MLDLLGEVSNTVFEAETAHFPRQRSRRPADAARLSRLLSAIVCDLAHSVLFSRRSPWLVYPLGHGCALRGPRNVLPGETAGRLFSCLELSGFAHVRPGRGVGSATALHPTTAFASKVRAYGVSLADFGRDPAEEVLIVRRSTPSAKGRLKHRVAVPETIEAASLRQDVRHLNAFYQSAPITFVDDGRGPVDAFQRVHRRCFTIAPGEAPHFASSGRLFGPWWQTVEKDRRANIRIGGEAVAVLDYASMFARLAYAQVGAEPVAEDLYDIPALAQLLTRKQIKRAVNMFLFGSGRGRRQWPEEDRQSFPAAATPKAVRTAIVAAHPCLETAFSEGWGPTLMRRESDVMVAVLAALASRGITALSLHDGLMVGLSHTQAALQAMEDIALAMVGIPLPVTLSHP
jgi:hypothetical protein